MTSAKMPISYSRLSTFEQCGLKFEYLYVTKQVVDLGSEATNYVPVYTRRWRYMAKSQRLMISRQRQTKPQRALMERQYYGSRQWIRFMPNKEINIMSIRCQLLLARNRVTGLLQMYGYVALQTYLSSMERKRQSSTGSPVRYVTIHPKCKSSQ